MKRGITELADIVVVNKADGELEAAAARACSDYRASLHLLGARKLAGWAPPVLRVSCHTGKGMDGLIAEIERHRAALVNVAQRRVEKEWNQLWTVTSRMCLQRMHQNKRVLEMLPHLKEQLERGDITIDMAAETILKTQ